MSAGELNELLGAELIRREVEEVLGAGIPLPRRRALAREILALNERRTSEAVRHLREAVQSVDWFRRLTLEDGGESPRDFDRVAWIDVNRHQREARQFLASEPRACSACRGLGTIGPGRVIDADGTTNPEWCETCGGTGRE